MLLDPQLSALVDRLLAGFRGQLEPAVRAYADEAADRRSDELRRSAEAQIGELRSMLEDIRARAHEHQTVLDARLAEAVRERDDALARIHDQLAEAYSSAVRLADDVRALSEAASLTSVFERLMEAASRRGDRAALATVAGERLRGWRSNGFDGAPGDGSELRDDAAGMIAAAARLGRAVSSREGAPVPVFAVAASSPADAAAFPIVLGGEVVAVLYIDLAASDERRRAAWPELEALARHAGTTLEVLTLRQSGGLAAPHVARRSQAASSSSIAGRGADVTAHRPSGGLQ